MTLATLRLRELDQMSTHHLSLYLELSGAVEELETMHSELVTAPAHAPLTAPQGWVL